MYVINNVIGGRAYTLHDQRNGDFRVLEPRLILTINKTGVLAFKLLPSHKYYNTAKKLQSVIQVLDDGEIIYEGRIMSDDSDFNNIKSIECEGSLAYLIDSIQRPFSYAGDVAGLLDRLISVHNSQVEPRKQFLLGNVNIVADGPEPSWEVKKPDNTWNIVNSLLVGKLNGCLRVRYQDGKKYIDYTHDYGGTNEQTIRFGVNLLDLTQHQNAANVATCLIPYGADVEYEDEAGETQTQTVDITSVNGGADYIQADQSVIDQYGKIWATYQWMDITDPSQLLEKARALLPELTAIPDTLKVKALDLNYTGIDIRRFRVGYWTNVESRPHGIQKSMLLAKLDMYLDDPGKGNICLGNTVQNFTSSTISKQVELSQKVQKTADAASEEIRRKIANATALITGGKGGYVVLDVEDPDSGEKTHPWRILIMNTPDKSTATNVIQFNQNGIGFSRTGINGPYANAWTIDGNLLADFVTSGTMLADRIRGGTMEVGGTGLGKDGAIVVKDAAGNTIGSWDKTGLSILKGILQGVSAVFGGTDNQNGSIEVLDAGGRKIGRWDKDGLYIRRGDLTVGPFAATEDGVTLGDWEVSADGSNVFRSQDGSVVMQTADGGPFGDYPIFILANEDEVFRQEKMELSCRMLDVASINATRIRITETTEWGAGTDQNGYIGQIIDYIWKDKNYGIKHLGHEVRSLQSQVDDLYEMINSL